ncbi:MAG TPA: ABC transporter permease, partial [Bryobacteraceae bacterium]|nr:ABC transporter permease [Bryobacteraceae bacterium]
MASGLPLVGGIETTFYRADRARPASGQEPFAVGRSVTPGYFHLLGIPVVRGRGFSDRDRKDSPRVAVINQNLARNFFDGENPIGKQLHILDGGDAAVPAGIVEIVGLTANVRDMGLDEVPFNDI